MLQNIQNFLDFIQQMLESNYVVIFLFLTQIQEQLQCITLILLGTIFQICIQQINFRSMKDLRNKIEEKGVDLLQKFLYAQGNLWRFNGCDTYMPATVTLHPYQMYQEDYRNLISANSIWAKLYIRMSQDFETIETLHKDSKDPMINNLLRIAKKSSEKQFKNLKAVFLRNDYIYNDNVNSFQQTQINLISAGLWTNSEKTQKFHQILKTLTNSNWKLWQQPSNSRIVDFYLRVLSQYQRLFPESKPHILKIAKGNGNCAIEQAQIQKQLLLRGHVLVCGTFNDLINRIDYDENTGRVLVDGLEIGLVYYRNGYMNDHYPDQNSWKVRQIFECSRVINLPNAKIQLVNFKSAQALVHTTDIARKYLEQEEIKVIEKLQAKIWSSEQVKENLEKIIEEYGKNIVVKNIHEGSEQNYFYQKAHQILRISDPSHFLVMELINSKSRPVLTLKKGKQIRQWNGVTEVGLYSTIIYEDTKILEDKYVSYTIRTYQQGIGQVQVSYGQKGFDSICFK